MKKFKIDRYLLFLLLITFLSRLPGVLDGLPAVFNSTEYFLAKTVLSMGAAKSIDPGFYIYPTLYTYFLLVLYGALYLIGSLLGFFQTQYDFAVQFLVDPSAIYLVSRLVNVLLSLTIILIIYQFLNRVATRFAAKLAAAFMALSLYMIKFSAYATADTILILFSALAIIYLYKLAEPSTSKDFFFAGLFCGLAIAAKYNAGFLLVGLAVAIFQQWRRNEINLYQRLGLSFGGVAVGFFITNPLWLIYPEKFYSGFRLVSSQMFDAVSAERGIPFIWEMVTLIESELVIGVLFILATVYYLFKRDYKHYPVLIVIILTFLYVGTWTKKGIDYLFPIFPAWVILSAMFVDHLRYKYFQHKSITRLLLLITIVPSLFMAGYQVIVYVNEDTREQTTDWLIENIKENQRVCYDNYHNDLGVFDIQKYISYGASADQLPEIIKKNLQGYANDPRQLNLTPILVRNPNNRTGNIDSYEDIAAQHKRRELEDLVKSGTSVLVTNSWYLESYLSIEIDKYPPVVQRGIKEVQTFYKQLYQNYEPVRVVEPGIWEAGPTLNIYELNKRR